MAGITPTDNKFLNALIQDCITYRLTEKEAIQYIKTRFREISVSSYNIRKANVLKDRTTEIWLNHFTRIGFVSSHRQHIQNIEKIQDDSFRQLLNEQNKPVRNERLILQLKADIRENTKLLSELSLGTPIISAIKAKLENNSNSNSNVQTLQVSQ